MDQLLNIVVVEDHQELREVTVDALTRMGHRVMGLDSAEAFDDGVGAFQPDIMVLDLNLPGEDGLSLAQRIRSALPQVGIIMVTARQMASDRVEGYASGADIYLTKPTSMEELKAALSALSRRLQSTQSNHPQLVLNPVTLQIVGGGGAVDVSDQECAILYALTKAPRHRLESWQLMEAIGKSPDDFNKSALEVSIVRLRKKLEDAGAVQPTIKAIRGSGYQLCTLVVVDNAVRNAAA